jgi:hypothetical protein
VDVEPHHLDDTVEHRLDRDAWMHRALVVRVGVGRPVVPVDLQLLDPVLQPRDLALDG